MFLIGLNSYASRIPNLSEWVIFYSTYWRYRSSFAEVCKIFSCSQNKRMGYEPLFWILLHQI